jgi:signal transduction histidine kinase
LLTQWQGLLPHSPEDILRDALVSLAEGRMIEMEMDTFTIDGEVRHVLIRSLVPPGYEDTWSKIFVSIQDLTERVRAEKTRKNLEIQLQRSQKLEAIGTLAGGIAHDFNNILSAIIGYTELAKLDLPTDDPVQAKLDQVYLAGSRAKDLVKQILAFSRQVERKHQIVQMDLIVKEAMKLLRSTLPTTIEIQQRIATHTMVKADPSQIYQVVMNLCTNAYQAMGDAGGTLTVELEDVTLKAKDVEGHPEVLPGPHVRLAVVDSGQGIQADVQERIFDPYFTTKEKSKGTGLGLAVVHGIIKSVGGMISVGSQPGTGSRFEVYLPKAEPAPMAQTAEKHPIPGGSERILFVDDEKLLTQMGQQMLIRLGYHVTALTSSESAWEAFQNAPDHFDLVITDMTMPRMTGLDLARKMLSQRPDLPVILCSGMRGDITPDTVSACGVRELITKPVTMQKMAEAIRRVLD